MSKDKKQATVDDTATVQVDTPAPSPVTVAPPLPAPNPKLMDVDRLALDLARERRKTALAEAKTALAQNDNAELSYKYVVLQIYMKYGLTDADAISEAGEIVKGGAVQKAPQAQVK